MQTDVENDIVVERIVQLARRFWGFDVRRNRYAFVVNSAVRMVEIGLGGEQKVTTKQKLEAEEILRLGKGLPG
jgi:hypothetical protein